MNVGDSPSTNVLPVDSNSSLEELDPFALGASEEVNTSRPTEDRNTIGPSGKITSEENETTIPEALGLRTRSLLNSSYKDSIANDAEQVDTEKEINHKKVNKLSNSDKMIERSIENGTDSRITDTEASVTTTTVMSEGVSMDTSGEYVVVEQVALEHITQLISASQAQASCANNTVVLQDESDRHQCSNNNQSLETPLLDGEDGKSLHKTSTILSEACYGNKNCEDINTREIAETLTNELKKYSIPQAVFARKILNRSQGTLSDVLRKPKPWSEMKGGRDIFRKMKEWLDLPEVKRIPQLRAEGGADHK